MRYAVCLVALFLAGPALGGDHDDIRRAVQAGEILPLSVILEKVRAEYSGELIEAELERKRGLPVYEIKLLTQGGKLLKLHYDARDASRLSSREKP
jgi:uncharacterized membrane protein YkoI